MSIETRVERVIERGGWPIHVIPNAGHCANQDSPEFFNRLLLEFLAAVERHKVF
jgi:pimeloyl-ACP methyl ester carboxylesterase